jgi:hypothetical protein
MKTRAVGLHVKSQVQLVRAQVNIKLAMSGGKILAVLGMYIDLFEDVVYV